MVVQKMFYDFDNGVKGNKIISLCYNQFNDCLLIKGGILMLIKIDYVIQFNLMFYFEGGWYCQVYYSVKIIYD